MLATTLYRAVLLSLALVAAANAAKAPLANGKTCSTSDQCASQSCQNSKCADLVANGGSCYKNNMCQSGVCSGDRQRFCVAKPAPSAPVTVTVTQAGPSATVTRTSTQTTTTTSIQTTTATSIQTVTKPSPLCGVPGDNNDNAPHRSLDGASPNGGMTKEQCKAFCKSNPLCKTYLLAQGGSYCGLYQDPLYQMWTYNAAGIATAYEIECD